MKENNKYENIFVADFETYVQASNTLSKQEETFVWCATYLSMMDGSKPCITSSFENMLISMTSNSKRDQIITVYFHNLKFDGAFIINYLLNKGYEFIHSNTTSKDGRPYLDKMKLRKKQYNCVISKMGQYYTITFNYYGYIIHVIDSLKLVPLSIKAMGKAFDTPHRKTEMDYTGVKSINMLTKEDREYIENDVYVLKEVLYYMFEQGYDGLTIGSCCMSEFRSLYGATTWDMYFPNLEGKTIEELGETQYHYIRKSYRGGWCYCNEAIAGKELHNGKVYDANSHYPSQMVLQEYPVGYGKYFKAVNNKFSDEMERKMTKKGWYYFIRFKCSFDLKDGYFPFIQIKGSVDYQATKMLKTSKVEGYDKVVMYCDGEPVYERSNIVEMTMTKSDWELFNKTYEIKNLEILDGLLFATEDGEALFGAYVHKHMNDKIEAGKQKNAGKKQCAKLFLNNLYGKFATDPDSSYKVPQLVNNVISYVEVQAREKKPGYIAIGSAITSYCRCITIGLANANYDNFAYADTDSVHLYNVSRDFIIKGIEIDPLELGAWKNESDWDVGKFLRAKTYIEHVTHEDGDPVEPYWNVKCAGMTGKGRSEALTAIEKEGPKVFDYGYRVTNLKPRQIKGGVLLEDTVFEIK